MTIRHQQESTSLGRNHFADLVTMANSDAAWHVSRQTIHDTVDLAGHPLFTAEFLEAEQAQGQSEEWLNQEYLCSFVSGLVGSYYVDLIRIAESDGRITDVPHRPGIRVTTACDLGISDATVFGFFQRMGERVHVIDASIYEGQSLALTLSQLQAKGYVYGEHLAPHDIEQREHMSGQSRKEQSRLWASTSGR